MSRCLLHVPPFGRCPNNSYRILGKDPTDPVLSSILLYVLTSGLLICLALYRRQTVTFSSLKPYPIVAVLVVSNALEIPLLLYSTKYLTAGMSITIWKLNPVWVMLLVSIAYRKPISFVSLNSLIAICVGVYLILMPSAEDLLRNEHFLYPLSGGIVFAVYTVFLSKLLALNSDLASRTAGTQAYLFALSAALIALFIPFLESFTLQITKTALIIIPLNAVRIAIVYALYSEALKRLSPVTVSAIVSIEVPLTIVFEWIVSGKAPQAAFFVGSLVIVMSSIVMVRENYRRLVLEA